MTANEAKDEDDENEPPTSKPRTTYARVRKRVIADYGDRSVSRLDPGQALGQLGTGQISVNCQ